MGGYVLQTNRKLLQEVFGGMWEVIQWEGGIGGKTERKELLTQKKKNRKQKKNKKIAEIP